MDQAQYTTLGVIHTVDPSLPNPEAILVGDDGRIAAVGTRAALERPGVRHVDLAGQTLIPGFNDAHVDVSWLGMLLTRLVDTRIHVAPNIPAIVERLAARAQSQPPGSWVEGVGYNEALLPEGRHLTRHDLDQASTAHPILVTRTCGHIAVANSLALHLAGIDAATPNPSGGVIVRDADGAPLGPYQAISPTEALWAYTQAGAVLSGDEQNRGSITRGKWADLRCSVATRWRRRPTTC